MTYTAAQMSFLTGLSYRQLDYWTHIGYLEADPTPAGSGFHRYWTAESSILATLTQEAIRTGTSFKLIRRRIGSLPIEDRIARLEDHLLAITIARRTPS